ncbi:hypothetical protein [Corynebacterium efficiens YS-314]|uniref:Uncharacterized protein n=1 Tax=Corynebacterium efficiens (strain DSM 44549 / YS-314 / AJ 12310 / JCM 11189 / NBRC 100395) TaxID=196164 RepID=Q8FS22_COREF|nr:hypothetical protein [Corynebacterium efficiens YS-314]
MITRLGHTPIREVTPTGPAAEGHDSDGPVHTPVAPQATGVLPSRRGDGGDGGAGGDGGHRGRRGRRWWPCAPWVPG